MSPHSSGDRAVPSGGGGASSNLAGGARHHFPGRTGVRATGRRESACRAFFPAPPPPPSSLRPSRCRRTLGVTRTDGGGGRERTVADTGAHDLLRQASPVSQTVTEYLNAV